MADKKISDFTEATSLDSADLFEIESTGGNSRKVKWRAVRGPISSHSGSAASSADIPLPSGYSRLRIVIYATFSTDGGNLTAQFTDDNFATVESGASDYNYSSWRVNTSATADDTSNAASSILLLTNKGNAAGDDLAGEIDVYFAGDSSKITRLMKSLTHGIGGSASPGAERGDGAYLTASAINGIRIAPSTGTMTYSAFVYGDWGS